MATVHLKKERGGGDCIQPEIETKEVPRADQRGHDCEEGWWGKEPGELHAAQGSCVGVISKPKANIMKSKVPCLTHVGCEKDGDERNDDLEAKIERWRKRGSHHVVLEYRIKGQGRQQGIEIPERKEKTAKASGFSNMCLGCST